MITLPEGTFYGAERARRRVGGLLLNETAFLPGEALPRHDHERAYFCLVLRGGFTERDGRRTRECRSATVIFHPPGADHSDRFGRETSRCAYYLRVELATDDHPVSVLTALRADDDAQRRASLERLRRLAGDHHAEIDLFGYHDFTEFPPEVFTGEEG